MIPSPYQQAIYAFVEDESAGNAIVEAVAGSGKTTTLVEAIRRVPFGASAIFLAFGKAIQTELEKRGVNARTFHSLCYSPVLRARGAKQAESNKLRILIDEAVDHGALEDIERRMYGAFADRLVRLARQAGIGCLIEDTEQNWSDIAEHHALELDNDRAEWGRAIAIARALLETSNASAMVDFDDMLYFAVKDGISLPKFDVIFVDEAQDTNAIQRAILRKIMKPGSRVIAVGDPAQAIYGFRGADSNSMNLIAEEFNCKRLPLTVSYRCPQAVVKFAQQWVSHIEPAEGAAEGSVAFKGDQFKVEDFVAGDLIVCRTTKPLVSLAYRCMKSRIPAKIMGREIGAGLASLIKKLNAKGIDALAERLQVYTNREVEKAIAKKQEAKAEAAQDRCDAIMFLIASLQETNRTVPALLALIESLFSDAVASVTLATIHKAKGLEAARVYWLNSSQCPSKWAKQEWQVQQEMNLCYVAATRAKSELILIEETRK